MKVPVLTYHAMNVGGNDYANNDHVALASDLRTLTRAGFAVEPLRHVVDRLLRGDARDGRPRVAICCDDGSDFDYRDIEHPTHGMQRSMVNVLRDFQREHPGAQPALHITCFVIVSPQARTELDRTCMIGRGWWNDDWWREAVASGLAGIGNHSWDHHHGTLGARPFADAALGTFCSVDRDEIADHEILRAQRHLLEAVPNDAAPLFAYPYGEHNEFLVDSYLPRLAARDPQAAPLAAFTTEPDYLTAASPRWRLPRFVCGEHWQSPAELDRILEGAR
ncbi:MAG TPA: polysaccharide deacetylase family protein [Usitatibacter sp.]|nr:polysaccharide deacetylase family protein [Usitatibacter sp.]